VTTFWKKARVRGKAACRPDAEHPTLPNCRIMTGTTMDSTVPHLATVIVALKTKTRREHRRAKATNRVDNYSSR
jgi:hypothetical protein